jgi:hypothetical protein
MGSLDAPAGFAAMLTGLAIASLQACSTLPADGPARLRPADAASLGALQAALALAVGRNPIALGAGDPTTGSSVAVLPSPPDPRETRALARPTIFDLAFRNGRCVAIQRDTAVAHPLPDVACIPHQPS